MPNAALFALTVSKPLIEKLARKLAQKYKDDGIETDPSGDLIPGPDELVAGLAQLLSEGKLDLGGATEASEFKNSLLDLVMGQVLELQKDSGGQLLPDGIIGRRFLKWVREHPKCGGTDRRPTPPGPGARTGASGRPVIRYYFEEETRADGTKGPQLPRLGVGASTNLAIAHLSIAVESWFMYLNLEVSQTGDPADANLIIASELLPGAPDKYLALTDVGPGPAMGRQLRMTFDKTESWTPLMFQATAAHEFGHVLGIRHRDVRQPNQLMNDTISQIATARQFDIEAARRLGWGSR